MAKLAVIIFMSLVFISLVYAATVIRNDNNEPLSTELRSAQCLTQADVLAHLERSRQGISLTCNEQIRQRNLAQ